MQTVTNYKEMIMALQAELVIATQQRDKAQEQMSTIIKAIKAIQDVAKESNQSVVEPPPLSDDEEQGFTDQVRAILKANVKALAAVEIRDLILERNPWADPKVTLIHTHNTLKRLLKQSEAVSVGAMDGRTAYKAAAPVLDLMAALKKSLADMDKRKIDAQAAQIREEETRKEKEARKG